MLDNGRVLSSSGQIVKQNAFAQRGFNKLLLPATAEAAAA